MKGVGRTAPFLMTLTMPCFSATNVRPSGRNAMPVGLLKPEATTSWVKLGSNVLLGSTCTAGAGTGCAEPGRASISEDEAASATWAVGTLQDFAVATVC